MYRAVFLSRGFRLSFSIYVIIFTFIVVRRGRRVLSKCALTGISGSSALASLLGLELPAQVTNHSQPPDATRMHREPEGGVRCQVLDFSASDEEVERSSTGSLSRGAVPKEAPGSLANGTFILVLRSFSLPLLSFSLSR